MTESKTEDKDRSRSMRKKGAVKQVFGCVLLFLGALNLMLAFKSGTTPDPFNYVLFLSGVVVLGLGILQSRSS